MFYPLKDFYSKFLFDDLLLVYNDDLHFLSHLIIIRETIIYNKTFSTFEVSPRKKILFILVFDYLFFIFLNELLQFRALLLQYTPK